MSAQTTDPEALIHALPIWSGHLEISPLNGGITNLNFLVADRSRRVVVRLGGDIPLHGVMRFNEQAASRAAGAAGLSPAVIYVEPSVLVLDYIEGRTYQPVDVRLNLDRCVRLVRRVHRELRQYLRGPTLCFNVFHIIRNYGHTLSEGPCRLRAELPRLLGASDELEQRVGAIDLVFAHNDLLAANFLDDGRQLWLIDWDYAGWNSSLFDLGGLSSNNEFSSAENDALLELYFEQTSREERRYQFQAMICASLLRETLWSLVSESRSTIDFDYKTYSNGNLQRFEGAWTVLREMA